MGIGKSYVKRRYDWVSKGSALAILILMVSSLAFYSYISIEPSYRVCLRYHEDFYMKMQAVQKLKINIIFYENDSFITFREATFPLFNKRIAEIHSHILLFNETSECVYLDPVKRLHFVYSENLLVNLSFEIYLKYGQVYEKIGQGKTYFDSLFNETVATSSIFSTNFSVDSTQDVVELFLYVTYDGIRFLSDTLKFSLKEKVESSKAYIQFGNELEMIELTKRSYLEAMPIFLILYNLTFIFILLSLFLLPLPSLYFFKFEKVDYSFSDVLNRNNESIERIKSKDKRESDDGSENIFKRLGTACIKLIKAPIKLILNNFALYFVFSCFMLAYLYFNMLQFYFVMFFIIPLSFLLSLLSLFILSIFGRFFNKITAALNNWPPDKILNARILIKRLNIYLLAVFLFLGLFYILITLSDNLFPYYIRSYVGFLLFVIFVYIYYYSFIYYNGLASYSSRDIINLLAYQLHSLLLSYNKLIINPNHANDVYFNPQTLKSVADLLFTSLVTYYENTAKLIYMKGMFLRCIELMLQLGIVIPPIYFSYLKDVSNMDDSELLYAIDYSLNGIKSIIERYPVEFLPRLTFFEQLKLLWTKLQREPHIVVKYILPPVVPVIVLYALKMVFFLLALFNLV